MDGDLAFTRDSIVKIHVGFFLEPLERIFIPYYLTCSAQVAPETLTLVDKCGGEPQIPVIL